MSWREVDADWTQAVCFRFMETHPQHTNPWTREDRHANEWAADACLDCILFSKCQTYVNLLPIPRVGVYAGEIYNEEPWRKGFKPGPVDVCTNPEPGIQSVDQNEGG